MRWAAAYLLTMLVITLAHVVSWALNTLLGWNLDPQTMILVAALFLVMDHLVEAH